MLCSFYAMLVNVPGFSIATLLLGGSFFKLLALCALNKNHCYSMPLKNCISANSQNTTLSSLCQLEILTTVISPFQPAASRNCFNEFTVNLYAINKPKRERYWMPNKFKMPLIMLLEIYKRTGPSKSSNGRTCKSSPTYFQCKIWVQLFLWEVIWKLRSVVKFV